MSRKYAIILFVLLFAVFVAIASYSVAFASSDFLPTLTPLSGTIVPTLPGSVPNSNCPAGLPVGYKTLTPDPYWE